MKKPDTLKAVCPAFCLRKYHFKGGLVVAGPPEVPPDICCGDPNPYQNCPGDAEGNCAGGHVCVHRFRMCLTPDNDGLRAQGERKNSRINRQLHPIVITRFIRVIQQFCSNKELWCGCRMPRAMTKQSVPGLAAVFPPVSPNGDAARP